MHRAERSLFVHGAAFLQMHNVCIQTGYSLDSQVRLGKYRSTTYVLVLRYFVPPYKYILRTSKKERYRLKQAIQDAKEGSADDDG